jgi:hypothetical protein
LRQLTLFDRAFIFARVKPQSAMKTALIIAALLGLSFSTQAQGPAVDAEKDPIKRAVETFLYAEDRDQVARVVDPQARIFSIKSGDNRVTITPLSAPAKKAPKGSRSRVPRQRITNIEVSGDGAGVSVQTDRMSIGGPSSSQKHLQYISLMRFKGEWKIVSILMPSIILETETTK